MAIHQTASPASGKEFQGEQGISTITPPARDGFTFTGWTVVGGNASIPSGGGTQTLTINSISDGGSNDVVLKANWQKN